MEKAMVKGILDFQKAMFDNVFSAANIFQDQAERATKMLIDSSPVPFPEEGRKMMDDWVEAFKRGREEFRRAVNESYAKMEESLTRTERAEEEEGPSRSRETRGKAERRKESE